MERISSAAFWIALRSSTIFASTLSRERLSQSDNSTICSRSLAISSHNFSTSSRQSTACLAIALPASMTDALCANKRSPTLANSVPTALRTFAGADLSACACAWSKDRELNAEAATITLSERVKGLSDRLSFIVGSAPAQNEVQLWSLVRGIGKDDELFAVHRVASSGSLNRSIFCWVVSRHRA